MILTIKTSCKIRGQYFILSLDVFVSFGIDYANSVISFPIVCVRVLPAPSPTPSNLPLPEPPRFCFALLINYPSRLSATTLMPQLVLTVNCQWFPSVPCEARLPKEALHVGEENEMAM